MRNTFQNQTNANPNLITVPLIPITNSSAQLHENNRATFNHIPGAQWFPEPKLGSTTLIIITLSKGALLLSDFYFETLYSISGVEPPIFYFLFLFFR